MDVDGKAPADIFGVPPAALGGVPPADIFGDSDDSDDAPPTWGGGCLSPKTCTQKHHTDTDPKDSDVAGLPDFASLPDIASLPDLPGLTDPADHKQPCRLMPKNYKKPPMHSGSVYNATELVRRNSTCVARNQSPPAAFSTPDKGAAQIENLVNKETPLPDAQKRSGLSASEDEDVDTN
jgi:hypothetical protein